MKKMLYIIIIFIFLFQITTKPVKYLANTSSTIGIKYTIWDEDYEEKDNKTKIIYYSISFLSVGTISFLIMRHLKKYMGDTKPKEKKTSIINSIQDVAIEKVYVYLNNENIGALKEKLFLKYVAYKTSYMNFEYDKLKNICENNFYNSTIEQLSGLNKNGYTNISHTFIIKNSKIGDIHEENNLIVIVIYLLINYYDYIEDTDKNVIAGRKIEPVEDCYKIEYIITKNKDNITCLKCGKKVFLEKDANCPYCGELVKIEAPDYLIRSITKC